MLSVVVPREATCQWRGVISIWKRLLSTACHWCCREQHSSSLCVRVKMCALVLFCTWIRVTVFRVSVPRSVAFSLQGRRFGLLAQLPSTCCSANWGFPLFFLLPLEKKKQGAAPRAEAHWFVIITKRFFFLVVHVFYSANGSQQEPFLPVDLMGTATSDVHTPSCSELLLSQQLVSVSTLCLQYWQNFLWNGHVLALPFNILLK